MEYHKPWVTCFFTNILLSYMDETYGEKQVIDCPSLFRGIEGFETPSDPHLFLKDYPYKPASPLTHHIQPPSQP